MSESQPSFGPAVRRHGRHDLQTYPGLVTWLLAALLPNGDSEFCSSSWGRRDEQTGTARFLSGDFTDSLILRQFRVLNLPGRGWRSRCSQGENDSGGGSGGSGGSGGGGGRNGKTPRTIPTCLREMIRAKSHLFGQSSLRGLVRGLGNTESLTKQQTARWPRSVCAKFKYWRAAEPLSYWVTESLSQTCILLPVLNEIHDFIASGLTQLIFSYKVSFMYVIVCVHLYLYTPHIYVNIYIYINEWHTCVYIQSEVLTHLLSSHIFTTSDTSDRR